jgi:hypothetical protein
LFTSRDGTNPIDRRRRERVVEPLDQNAVPYSAASDSIGPLVSAIGEKAEIIVGERTKAGTVGKAMTAPKVPSGHDLRQAFGSLGFGGSCHQSSRYFCGTPKLP